MKKITIILPVYNEEQGIENTISEISNVFDNLDYSPFYLVVDDGSTDNTWRVVSKISHEDDRIEAISLSRNFGKEKAIFAGIQNTKTSSAIIMDADLQHPPQVIPELLKKWEETDCDVVHGVKDGRENESSPEGILVSLFYRIYNWCSGSNLTGASDFKLLNQRALDSYSKLNEQELFFRGLVPWLGFKQEAVTYKIATRKTGVSKWNKLSRVTTAINAIASFSSFPLHIITVIGFIFLTGAVFMTLYTLYEWVLGQAPEGFTTIIILLLIIGSALMISLGIIGKYLAHIYNEVKDRPTYLIRDHLSKK